MLWLITAALVPLQAANEVEGTRTNETAVAEIGLASGKVLRATIISREKKEIIYRVPGSVDERRLPLEEVIFIRSAGGKYEFIFPDDEAAEGQASAGEKHSENSAAETLLIVGFGLSYSNNSTLTDFANDYAKALAADYNSRLSPAGFVAQPGLAAGSVSALFSAEYRWLRGDYMFGLGAGYTVIPKSSAVVSSAAYSGEETINVDGYAVPVSAIFYYRLWGDRDFGFCLGAGGGALFTSVLLTRNFGRSSDYEEARGLMPMLLLRPELHIRTGPVTLIAALPFFWAEGKPINSEVVLPSSGARVAAASFTGIGLNFAVGYSF